MHTDDIGENDPYVRLRMMARSLLYCLLVACLLGRPGDAHSDPIPDDSLRGEMTPMISAVLADGDGKADHIGDTVVVSGRVTARPGRLGSPGANVAVLQDGTHGIHLLLPDGPLIERGDSLLVRGRLTKQRGLVKIDVSQYRVVAGAPRVPAPIPLTGGLRYACSEHRGAQRLDTGVIPA